MAHYQIKYLPTEYRGFEVVETAIYRGQLCRVTWDVRGEEFGEDIECEFLGKWEDGFNEWDDMLDWLDEKLDAQDHEFDRQSYAEEHRLRSYQMV